jgi:hypothetical protein
MTLDWNVANDGGQSLARFRLPKHSLDATRAPLASDDDTQGYAKGSVWVYSRRRPPSGCAPTTRPGRPSGPR